MNQALATTQTEQNPVSVATIKSVRLTTDEKARVKKDEAIKRKAYLKTLEADAQKIVSGLAEAKDQVEQAKALHRKFKNILVEMRPTFERVREGFAHLRKGEKIMGEINGPAWADKHLGITYDWFCRCLNSSKNGSFLLTDGTKVLDPKNTTMAKGKKDSKTPPEATNWTDEEYVKTCLRLIEKTLKPLEADPDTQRLARVATAIAQEILGGAGTTV